MKRKFFKAFGITSLFLIFISATFLKPEPILSADVSQQQIVYPSQTYEYKIELTIPKPKTNLIFPLNKIARSKISVTIPVNWPGTDLYISSVTPKPVAMQYGETWAQNQSLIFSLPVDSEQKIEITGQVVISPINLDLLAPVKKAYQSATIDQLKNYILYVNASGLVDSNDPEIIKTADQIKGTKTNVSDIISATYDFVVKRINYNYLSLNLIQNGQFVKPQSAVETLESGSGICGDYSRLMIALLRAEHIPARMVVGIIGTGQFTMENNPLHAWVQAYVPGVGFIDIDPTWGENGKKYISEIDMDHIRMEFSTPDNENAQLSTNFFDAFDVMYLDSSIYKDLGSQFVYGENFTKVDKVTDTGNIDNIRALAPVFISPEGYQNSLPNTIAYMISTIICDPIYLFVAQIAIPVMAIILFLIFHKKKK